jgi:hypothetical protein
MRGLRVLTATLMAALAGAAPTDASVWQEPVALDGVPFSAAAQIAVNDSGEVVTLLKPESDTGAPRLDWLSAEGVLHPPQARRGVLGSAGDGTMFLLSREGQKLQLATKPPGQPFGPDIAVAQGPGGDLIDVNSAGDIAMALGDDLGLLRRDAVSVERIVVPAAPFGRFSDIELTEGGEILAARVSSSAREVVIVPPDGGPARAERLADGGCDLQIAAGPDGRAVAAWNPPANDYSCEGSQNIAALRPAGGSFAAGANVPGLPGQTEPHVAVDANGRAVLAYDSSYPNGVRPYVVLLTAGPSDTTWTTSTSFLGYTDAIATSPAGVWLAYGSSFIGPHTARVSDAGTIEDVQDVVADCQMGAVAFGLGPSGRAAMLGWRFGPQQHAILRQVPGAAPAWKCARDWDQMPEQPAPTQPSPPAPITKPLAKPATTVTASVRSASRRRVIARFMRSDPGRLLTSGTLRVGGHRAIKAKASGSKSVALTFRVPVRTWRTLARKRAVLTLKATSPEGGRWDFRRSLKR